MKLRVHKRHCVFLSNIFTGPAKPFTSVHLCPLLCSVHAPSQTRVPTQGQIQAQAGQTAQVTLTKPPVVSVPAVVSSAGVTTLPVTVAGISVAIGQAQKTGMFKDFFYDLYLF